MCEFNYHIHFSLFVKLFQIVFLCFFIELKIYNLGKNDKILPDANVRAITFTGTFPFVSTENPRRIQLEN